MAEIELKYPLETPDGAKRFVAVQVNPLELKNIRVTVMEHGEAGAQKSLGTTTIGIGALIRLMS